MSKLNAILQTITSFFEEFITYSYLCYTEHGQHALFYSKLFAALPEEQRYISDWSPGSSQILTLEQVIAISEQTTVEIYYGMADSTGTYETGIWFIKSVQMSKII